MDILYSHTIDVFDENTSMQFTATSLSLWFAHLEGIR